MDASDAETAFYVAEADKATRMSDLREAIAEFEEAAGPEFYDCELAILAAARRFLALTETGQRIEWCETHASIAYGKGIECYYRYFVDPAAEPCSIVPKLVADYLTEEE